MDGRPNNGNKAACSNFSGEVLTRTPEPEESYLELNGIISCTSSLLLFPKTLQQFSLKESRFVEALKKLLQDVPTQTGVDDLYSHVPFERHVLA